MFKSVTGYQLPVLYPRGSEHLKVDKLRVIEHGTSGVPLKQDYHCQMIAGCDDVIILF